MNSCERCDAELDGACDHGHCPDCLVWCLRCEEDLADARADLDRKYDLENRP